MVYLRESHTYRVHIPDTHFEQEITIRYRRGGKLVALTDAQWRNLEGQATQMMAYYHRSMGRLSALGRKCICFTAVLGGDQPTGLIAEVGRHKLWKGVDPTTRKILEGRSLEMVRILSARAAAFEAENTAMGITTVVGPPPKTGRPKETDNQDAYYRTLFS